jgi:DNA-binding transcriptional MerR regulator
VFSSREASAITGLTRRQLAYWAKSGLVAPSHRSPGGHARYSFTDLIALRTAGRLLDGGVSLQKIRRSIAALLDFLPACGRPLSELSLLASGDAVVVFRDGAAFEAVSGQAWILPVADMLRDVDRLRGKTAKRDPIQQTLFPESDHAETRERSA